MDNRTASRIINEGGLTHPLRLSHLEILFKWYKDDKYFGFKDGGRFEEQLQKAVKFIISNEKEWQSKIADNYTRLSLNEYLYSKRDEDGIEFSQDFLKGEKNGLNKN